MLRGIDMLRPILALGYMLTMIGCYSQPTYNGGGGTVQAPNNSDTRQPGTVGQPSVTPNPVQPSSELNTAEIDALCSYGQQGAAGFGIVGGQEASMQDLLARTTVKLLIDNSYCTGTIIGPNQISTAAHCFETMPTSVQIGWGINGTPSAGTVATAWSVHPRYADMFGQNGAFREQVLYDVAVVTFSGPIPTGYGIAPVGSTQGLQSGTEITLAGYGAISENDQSSPEVLRFVTKAATFDPNFKEVQLEVGGGTGGCYGDSGGPSYITDPQRPACLRTLSTTTGPGRNNVSGSCDEGSGTLMDITLYQGWMSCTFEKMGAPLAYLNKADGSEVDCAQTNFTNL